MSALPHSQKTDRGKDRQERNTLPSGTLGLAMSKCPVLLSANHHGCVAGWITRWPFHLRNHNLNPAGSHQRINRQRHLYFKVIKHYKKGKGGTFIFFKPWFWPPIQLASLALLLQTGTRIQNWQAPSTGPSRSQNLAQAHDYCKTDISSQVSAWNSNSAAERVMADSMEHTQHELKLLAEMPVQTQGVLNYSFKRNLNVSYCSFTSNHGCIFKNRQINEAI